MDIKERILEVMKKENKPLNSGKIAELLGEDKKIVEKGMKELREAGLIESPRRCYWQPKK